MVLSRDAPVAGPSGDLRGSRRRARRTGTGGPAPISVRRPWLSALLSERPRFVGGSSRAILCVRISSLSPTSRLGSRSEKTTRVSRYPSRGAGCQSFFYVPSFPRPTLHPSTPNRTTGTISGGIGSILRPRGVMSPARPNEWGGRVDPGGVLRIIKDCVVKNPSPRPRAGRYFGIFWRRPAVVRRGNAGLSNDPWHLGDRAAGRRGPGGRGPQPGPTRRARPTRNRATSAQEVRRCRLPSSRSRPEPSPS
jgi:hypothetical protein